MSSVTIAVDAPPPSIGHACTWCGDDLVSPYLRRPDGAGLHVACIKGYALAATRR